MKVSDEEFIDIVKSETNIRQVLNRMGLRPAGGNYLTIKQRIKRLEIDISHHTGMGWLKGKTHNFTPKRSLDEILVKDSDGYLNSHRIKLRLIENGLIENRCAECKRDPVWNGKPLSLHLDHKNGDRTDNRIENLRLLCPNCHSQTPTYAGRNKKGKKHG